MYLGTAQKAVDSTYHPFSEMKCCPVSSYNSNRYENRELEKECVDEHQNNN